MQDWIELSKISISLVISGGETSFRWRSRHQPGFSSRSSPSVPCWNVGLPRWWGNPERSRVGKLIDCCTSTGPCSEAKHCVEHSGCEIMRAEVCIQHNVAPWHWDWLRWCQVDVVGGYGCQIVTNSTFRKYCTSNNLIGVNWMCSCITEALKLTLWYSTTSSMKSKPSARGIETPLLVQSEIELRIKV